LFTDVYKVVNKKLKYGNLNYNVFTDYSISYMNSHQFRNIICLSTAA